jgi:AraC-like DNA-binding protein
MEPQQDLGLHWHNHVELVIITGGRGTHLLVEAAWSLARGDVFVIPPRMAHGYAECQQLCLTNILIDTSLADPRHSPLAEVPGFTALTNLEPLLRAHHEFGSHLKMADHELERILAMVAALEEEIEARAPGHQVAVRSHLNLILLTLARRYAQESSPHNEALMRIESVLHKIDSELERPLRLEQLAKAGGMSVSTLHRHFRTCFGTSPTNYLIRRRIERAEQLLAETDAPIAHVGNAVGVADANYFTRLFRQHTGKTPRAYRRQCQSQRVQEFPPPRDIVPLAEHQ